MRLSALGLLYPHKTSFLITKYADTNICVNRAV
jgi:hypothetical protein